MEHSINKLLNILIIYQSLIRQNLIDSNYLKKGSKLNDEIDKLKNTYSSHGDLYSFDYKSLSRDIAAIFHPDIFKPLTGIIDNPDAMLAETFGILDDISKLIKERESKHNSTPFTYNYGTDTYSYSNNYNKNENNKKEEDNKKYQNNNSNYNYDFDSDESYEEVNDQGIYGTYTIMDFVRERFNAIFKGIPANSNDYFKIKSRMEKLISSLKNQLDIVNKGILVLSKEIDNNKINWKKETSDSEIEGIYQKNLSYLYRQMKELEAKYNESKKELVASESLFEQTINQQFILWQNEANDYINKFNRCMYIYNTKKERDPNADLKKVEKQIREMNSVIIKKYSNSVTAYEDLKKLILNSNESYRNAQLFVKKAYTKYQNMCNRYNGYRDNPFRQKDAIKKGVNVRFFIAEKKILITLKGQRKQRSNIFAKLRKAEEKFNNFYSEYANEYEESEKSK